MKNTSEEVCVIKLKERSKSLSEPIKNQDKRFAHK